MIGKVLNHLRGMSGYNKKGEELPDPRPTALHIDVEAEMPLHQKIMRAIQSDGWNRKMQEQGMETFEEANDFDVPDDPEFKSFHQDDEGDVRAYDEGVRSGFVEEIPQSRKDKAHETTRIANEHMRTMRSGDRRKGQEPKNVSDVSGGGVSK